VKYRIKKDYSIVFFMQKNLLEKTTHVTRKPGRQNKKTPCNHAMVTSQTACGKMS